MLGRAIDPQLPRVIMLSTNPLVNPFTALRNDPKTSLCGAVEDSAADKIPIPKRQGSNLRNIPLVHHTPAYE